MNRLHSSLIRTISLPAILLCGALEPAVAQGQTGSPAGPRRGGADPSPDAVRMGSPASLPASAARESMWPAPTAEDWKAPCLIAWQRSFDDAVRVGDALTAQGCGAAR